jgi:hypothetical protein
MADPMQAEQVAVQRQSAARHVVLIAQAQTPDAAAAEVRHLAEDDLVDRVHVAVGHLGDVLGVRLGPGAGRLFMMLVRSFDVPPRRVAATRQVMHERDCTKE